MNTEQTKFDPKRARIGAALIGKDDEVLFLAQGKHRSGCVYVYPANPEHGPSVRRITLRNPSFLRMATRAECEAAGAEYIEPPLNSEDESAMLVIAHLNGYEAGKKNAEARIKELEDGIRNLLDIHLQGVDKPAKSVWERKLNVAIHRLSKLIGIES